MAPIEVDPAHVQEFADADSFYAWLGGHHDREREVWIRIYKTGSGLASVTPLEAIDVALCWGWIDAIRDLVQAYEARLRARVADAGGGAFQAASERELLSLTNAKNSVFQLDRNRPNQTRLLCHHIFINGGKDHIDSIKTGAGHHTYVATRFHALSLSCVGY